MENGYALALWKLVDSGSDPKDAVRRVAEALEKAGRRALMPRIARAFARLSERDAKGRARLYVASPAQVTDDAIRALSVAEKPETAVDETLIGGWRYIDKDRLVDASYKRYLLDIYHRATR